MSLVEAPGFLGGQILLVDSFEDGSQRFLGAGQLRGVGKVERVAGIFQRLSGSFGLLDSCDDEKKIR